MIKARLTSGAKIQTTALGLEGAPYHAGPGAVVTFKSDADYKRAVALYGEGVFELMEKDKPKAAEGPREESGR